MSEEISEQAMTIIEMLWHPGNYHSRENAIKITQAAINEVTAEKDKEIASLREALEAIGGASDETHTVLWCADTAALAIKGEYRNEEIERLNERLKKAEKVLGRFAGEGYNRAKFYFEDLSTEQTLEQKGES